MAFELLEYPGLRYDGNNVLDVRLNHLSLLDYMCSGIKSQIKDPNSIQLFYQLLEQLDRTMTWDQVEIHLLELGVSRSSLKELNNIYNTRTCSDFEKTISQINAILSSRSLKLPENPLSELRMLVSHINGLKINCNVIYSPLMAYNYEYYKRNFIFQISTGEKKRGASSLYLSQTQNSSINCAFRRYSRRREI